MFIILKEGLLALLLGMTFFNQVKSNSTSSKLLERPQLRVNDIRANNSDKINVDINWSVNMTDSNLIWSTGFEDNEYIPIHSNITPNSITSEEKFSGNKSLKITDSKINGNFQYTGSVDKDKVSRVLFENIYNLEPGMKFSANFKAKNTGEEAMIHLIPESSNFSKYSTPFHDRYGLSEPIIIDKDTNKGDTIKIRNFDVLYNYMNSTSSSVWVANKIVTNHNGKGVSVTKANLDANTRTLNVKGANFDYKTGEELHFIFYVYPLKLTNINISNEDNWDEYSINGVMQNLDNYDLPNQGLKLIMENINLGSIYIDEFKLGYASKVKLFRDSKQIYEGYDARFTDVVNDTQKPNKIENIKYNIQDKNNNKIIKINFNTPNDNGETHTYNAVAVDKDGIESPYSKDILINTSSGIAGYSYVIDSDPLTNPDSNIDSNTNKLEYVTSDKSANLYLHIKAIDKSGNASETTHFKLNSNVTVEKNEDWTNKPIQININSRD